MRITLNKKTALAITRALRAGAPYAHVLFERTDIVAPDPFPKRRWSKKAFIGMELGLPLQLKDMLIEVAVPDGSKRLGTQGISNTVYAKGLPKGAFVDLGNGIVISSPELLFLELSESMNPVEHLMLGHELCGTFSRDALDPYNGPISYGTRPVTSCERIHAFLDDARYIRGIDKAAKTLYFLNNNAWSPTESLVAALLRLPVDSLGYDIGELELNPRMHVEQNLPGAKESRVPDIMIAGTPVGVNYDGLVHLNLNSIVDAAIDVGAHPEIAQTQVVLNRAVQSLRTKAIDDIRRNRELAAEGMFVFPLTKEDLYTPGGLDLVVAQLLDALERYTRRNTDSQRRILCNKALCRDRHRVMLSLLPGKSERGIQIGRYLDGHKVSEGPCTVHECWVEL